jgi:hypothetical protein
VPVTVQVITSVVLVVAIGWRSRRWRMISVPLALFVGVALTGAVCWFIADRGLADHPAPLGLWVWITLTGLAAVVVALGWRDGHWWRRGVSILAVPLCVLCAALTVNTWVGYYPTVGSAWDRMTGAPLPGQTDRATVAALQQQHRAPDWKTIRVRENPRRCIGIQTPRRARPAAAGVVRQHATATVTRGDDDRR